MSSLALVYGLNYSGTPNALKGCGNDARAMGIFLKEKARFDRVRVVTDDTDAHDTNAHDTHAHDTHAISIMKAIDELIALTNVQNISHLWIHFSGHGTQLKAQNPYDELDNKDECIVASDNLVIRDNFFKKALTRANPSTRIVFVFDCCHSGTMCDLDRTSLDADVVCLSGCDDHETTRDQWDDAANEWRGAFTTNLLESLHTQLHSPITDLLQGVNNERNRVLRRAVCTTTQQRTRLL